jgi:hypothetical protein
MHTIQIQYYTSDERAGTPQQLKPITAGPLTYRLHTDIQKQQLITLVKLRQELQFKHIDLHVLGSSASKQLSRAFE